MVPSPVDGFGLLALEYGLGSSDLEALRSHLPYRPPLVTSLMLAQSAEQPPTMVLGAPCLRTDPAGTSLNTFYQIFMPMKAASVLQVECKIFLGIREEHLLQPAEYERLQRLGQKLDRAITHLASHLHVPAQAVVTTDFGYDRLIMDGIRSVPVNLSAAESTHLWDLRAAPPPRPLHSPMRTLATNRVVACNTYHVLSRMFGQQSYLLVEDIEQFPSVRAAWRLENRERPEFLAFLPLPAPTGRGNLFSAPCGQQIRLDQPADVTAELLRPAPPWVLHVYAELVRLVDGTDLPAATDPAALAVAITRLANLFLG